MIARRSLLVAGTALVLLPRRALAQDSRLTFGGSQEQGGLMIGRTLPGAKVTVDDRPVLVSPEGVFAFGLAYDSTDPVPVAAQFPDGTSQTTTLTAQPRPYEEQAINGLPEEYVEPPPEVAARLAREREQVWKARLPETDGMGFAEKLEWPFAGIVSGVYGSRRILNGKPKAPHLGIDIAAPEGTEIHAATDGTVTISDDYFIEGGFTLIDHGHGVSTCYLHQMKRLVAVGDKVARGQVIGLVGKTGRATGPHTHWGLAWFQLKLDPSRVTRTPAPS
jgi:murein DD-endopeptidase MepM/ murein hydrolase activator NlpD